MLLPALQGEPERGCKMSRHGAQRATQQFIALADGWQGLCNGMHGLTQHRTHQPNVPYVQRLCSKSLTNGTTHPYCGFSTCCHARMAHRCKQCQRSARGEAACLPLHACNSPARYVPALLRPLLLWPTDHLVQHVRAAAATSATQSNEGMNLLCRPEFVQSLSRVCPSWHSTNRH
jgi:hypothetical protein